MICTLSYNFDCCCPNRMASAPCAPRRRMPSTLIGIDIAHQEPFEAEAPSNVKILSYNPGHDGAITFLQDGRLMMSIEAEKDSNYRYSPVSSPDVFNALGDIDAIPDVLCTGGWWPRDHYDYLHGSDVHV